MNFILLAFFILLVALSQPNRTKEAELLIEVRKAFQSFGGPYLGLGRFLEERGVSRERNPLESTRLVERFLGELTLFIQENEEAQELSYQITSEGLTIHLTEAFTFREGSDQLLQRNLALMNSIHDLILRTTNPVRIEGHTDNRDLRTERIRDNWELSAARAMTVFRFLTETGEIPASRFSVVGYGDRRPLASNLTASGRNRNRRVTITLVGRLRRVGEE
ncbi:MAG: flagellar motor protein MotB [SAR324 cluster bacterium]|nr:flagellar motor protein MotB [SAR324 cluster bacterium]